MLKFIRGKGQQTTAERQKLQKDLFAFRKTVQHGFPNKPTALAWDPSLRLMIIGTASGAIKVFGRPGVEFYGLHSTESGENAVTKIIALPNQGRLVSLCDDNSLHLWEINTNSVVMTKSLPFEGKIKKISAMCLESNGEHLLLGTEGGNIYLLNVKTFTMSDNIIYQDVVMQNVPDDYKKNPGAVEAIAEQPGHPDNILIGYNRGLMVLWNKATPGAQQTFVSQQQLESVHWVSENRFVSSHNDGSYTFWSPGSDVTSEPTTVYGPFPCKAISKIMAHPIDNDGDDDDDEIILFSGGMPRSSYGDRHTVTTFTKTKHVVFDLTSKVIDFFTILPKQDEDEKESTIKSPEALIILAEEEIVAIDLTDPEWKMMSLPYLVSLHASAVTCSQHVQNIPDKLWDDIVMAGKLQIEHLYSDKSWPIDGGVLLNENNNENNNRELLLTGHEDGTVRFWNASNVVLTPIYKYNSSILFNGEHLDALEQLPDEDEEEWPPFRKIGTFDPYSDDPRLAVKKILLCPLSSTLVVAGTAGHIIIAKISSEINSKNMKSVTMNIVNDRDGFAWKGHDNLPVRSVVIDFTIGFQPDSLVQLYPPAAVTALSIHSEWGLIAAGTAHGLAVFDYIRNKPIIVKCTLNPNDLSGSGDTPISRRKSFKKSLRESFRRLRKGRSQRCATTTNNTTTPSSIKNRNINSDIKKDISLTSNLGSPSNPDTTTAGGIDVKPIERQVEARPVDDAFGSMVRSLYFARSFIISMQNTTPTLWAGTNNGTVYVFTLAIPAGIRRKDENVICTLGKEIQLKHRAPVIAITIIDGSSVPLPEPYETDKPDMTSPHRVIIASEEQFKIFNLPSLKPSCKYKLTAHEGSRVRKTGFAKFTCPIEPTGTIHEETCLLCLTNLGDCLILSIPDMRRQLNAAAIKREDINGISSLTFTKSGEAFYLHSSSELERISLSVTKVTKAQCALNLLPNARESLDKSPETEEEEEDDEEGDDNEEENEEIDNENEKLKNTNDKQDEIVDKLLKHKYETQSNEANKTITENGIGNDESKDSILKSGTSTNDVNGNGGGSGGGGGGGSGGDDDRSIGDITIDSVKDHLLNSSLFRNATSSEDLHNRLAGLKMEVTSRTSEISTQNQSLVVKTTTVISQTSANGTTNGEIETNQINESQQINSTTVEQEINSGSETTTTHATITLPPNVEISAADLANLEVQTTTVTTEKSKSPVVIRTEEIIS
ncbi:lethal(2) giant larvae protein homolog 1 isoform X2 [Aphidius gifuensis]|uniref:lethal(2) giant larvae protein homolog 1 isoform X2 n=1 Tax=Aphidius gifuensis TaxID=684658 RepID=UPI001CDBF5AA|nr:lethal(2) giant larvae protein homolog 1 isoform X2 [Aphidius gifuensis]